MYIRLKKQLGKRLLRLSTQPGFRKYVEGFQINCYELDRDHWVEGFISTWVNDAGEIECDEL